MQTTEASYPFKKIKSEIGTYNGNKRKKSLLIKNIPTRFLLGMIDADNYTIYRNFLLNYIAY